MDPQLTERLVCPRCGPGFGLVLRADQVEEGRVLGGFLGCSNCRQLYPIERGVADLRPQPGSRSRARGRDPGSRMSGGASQHDALHVAALLGVTRGPACIAVAGAVARTSPALAALLPGVEVVALAPRFDFGPAPGVNLLLASERIPVRSGVLAGIALAGIWAELLLDEAVRSVARSGRIVLLDASAAGEQAFASHNLAVLVNESGTLVGRLA